MKTILMTNGRGIFKYIAEGKRIPLGWQVAEKQPVDPKIAARQRKEDIAGKLEAAGIPFDGRMAADDLEALLTMKEVDEEE